MKLVRSSNPDDVDRDTAVRLLAERAVLTRSMCRELSEATGDFADRRPCIAMHFLLRWILENMPESCQNRTADGSVYQNEPRPSDGIDLMIVPDGCEDLLQEIRDGAEVGDGLFMLWTADTQSQFNGDQARIRQRLGAYMTKHGGAVRAPSPIECWSGFPKGGADPKT
jgi:hypothetical protein